MEETVTNGFKRNEDGTFAVGTAPGPGAPIQPEEVKLAKKAAKEIIAEYKERLAEALPKIEPILIEKAIAGDISFIKELHDRSMGKADQKTDITTGGDKIIIGNPEVAAKFDEFLKQQSKG